MITNFELIFQRISSCFTLALGEVVLWRDGARRHIHPHIHHIILFASPAYSDSPAYLFALLLQLTSFSTFAAVLFEQTI